MNISLAQADKLNGVITVKVEKVDYDNAVSLSVKKYAKTMNVPGFRKGMVPIAHVQRMYGTSILLDEVTKLLNDALGKYIEDNKINTLGQPIIKSDSEFKNDLVFGNDFTFEYEIGIAPEIDLKISSKDKITQYKIELDKETLDERIKNIQKSFGTSSNPDVSEEGDLLYGKFEQLDQSAEVYSEGLQTEGRVFTTDLKDKAVKKMLTGLRKEDTVTLNIPQDFNDNVSLVARTLGIDEVVASNLKSKFKFTVTNILRVLPAELNQELFDKVYGKDVVKTEQEFKAKIEEELSGIMSQNSDVRLAQDIRTHFSNNPIELPAEFLKKWLLQTNEKLTNDELEAGFEQFADRLKWELIENKIIKDNDIKIEYSDVLNLATQRIETQFKMYSPGALPDNLLQDYVQQFLSNKENANKIFEEVKSQKVFEYLKTSVTLATKDITYKEFIELK